MENRQITLPLRLMQMIATNTTAESTSPNTIANKPAYVMPSTIKSNVTRTAEELLQLVRPLLKEPSTADTLLLHDFEDLLTMFKNEAYTQGYTAATETTQLDKAASLLP